MIYVDASADQAKRAVVTILSWEIEDTKDAWWLEDLGISP